MTTCPAPGTGATVYRGRFAPSPSGPLHFGSLVTAVGSYLDARASGGHWLLRIEDLDQPRTQPGATAAILRTLEAFGFAWDEEVVVQSHRLAGYRHAFELLQAAGMVYPCACSRSEIAALAALPSVDGGRIYPGSCRSGLPSGRSARAWRLCVPSSEIVVDDRLQGRLRQTLARDVGDFALLRADGTFAYQLAVVVDDAAQGINAVVRGADLFDSTPRQIWLQRCLGVPTPSYAHLPVVTNAAGEKLSKQTRAPAVDAAAGSTLLAAALTFLGHTVPAEIAAGPVGEFWSWSIQQWSLSRVPAVRAIVQGCPLPP
ncbi:MAG TPA: tRNA glutamyl-Q(34) synthetase GluQRS [Accumulibacter sp.]|nr:tRNA glutamyl-Q(34) synthetase GluQRS [Accumulibacter sp.]HMW18080.1 tRNA glutamyl-Q(34) synthetase GluQRS [Accumulibacter sp.]HNC18138.1 tRNA glutamyl-Q(34) synthetase GluQRS [Accumulibacter sp.]HND80685.1 tRNA glutamyl-Q(34) synthetase GluQRS [Accumulibacter sp.]HNE13374.1 tRNA glutamyl-Q(34) synthetase GluQRS [Accumulibacter sp.]